MTAATQEVAGLPDMKVSIRQVFGFDSDMEVPAFSEPDEQFGFSWNSDMVAFEKLEHDQRKWDFDRDF